MSADAKIWPAVEGHFGWVGIHDGDCSCQEEHSAGSTLSELIIAVERCMRQTMRWEIRRYEAGDGLSGYLV